MIERLECDFPSDCEEYFLLFFYSFIRTVGIGFSYFLSLSHFQVISSNVFVCPLSTSIFFVFLCCCLVSCNGWTQHMLRARSQSYQLCKMEFSPIPCSDNLKQRKYVVFLFYFSSNGLQMLLKSLNELKQTDGRLNLTQGVLEGVFL